MRSVLQNEIDAAVVRLMTPAQVPEPTAGRFKADETVKVPLVETVRFVPVDCYRPIPRGGHER